MFALLSIVVNCGLLVTFGVVEKLLPSVGFYESIVISVVIEVCMSYFKIQMSKEIIYLRNIYLKHIFLVFHKFLKIQVPDIPEWIIIEKCKLENRRREALKVTLITHIDK